MFRDSECERNAGTSDNYCLNASVENFKSVHFLQLGLADYSGTIQVQVLNAFHGLKDPKISEINLNESFIRVFTVLGGRIWELSAYHTLVPVRLTLT